MSAEGEPPIERQRFKSTRDNALYELCEHGWGIASSGNPEAPTGWFAMSSVQPDEVAEITQAFEERFHEIAFDHPQQLVGNFLVVEGADTTVEVTPYRDYEELRRAWLVMLDAYEHWLTQGRES